jgi:hypothetical protein
MGGSPKPLGPFLVPRQVSTLRFTLRLERSLGLKMSCIEIHDPMVETCLGTKNDPKGLGLPPILNDKKLKNSNINRSEINKLKVTKGLIPNSKLELFFSFSF